MQMSTPGVSAENYNHSCNGCSARYACSFGSRKTLNQNSDDQAVPPSGSDIGGGT